MAYERYRFIECGLGSLRPEPGVRPAGCAGTFVQWRVTPRQRVASRHAQPQCRGPLHTGYFIDYLLLYSCNNNSIVICPEASIIWFQVYNDPKISLKKNIVIIIIVSSNPLRPSKARDGRVVLVGIHGASRRERPISPGGVPLKIHNTNLYLNTFF